MARKSCLSHAHLRRPPILHAHQDLDCMLGHGSLSPLGMLRALNQLIHGPPDNRGVSAYLDPLHLKEERLRG